MKTDVSHDLLDEADELGHEARAGSGTRSQLRLWLRLLACTTQIEDEIRRRLRTRFGITLTRFDYMAQLHRVPDGMRMKELSRCLMVTGANVTLLTDDLEREGLVERASHADDRRVWIVKLTPQGRRVFGTMAREHEQWVADLFGGLDEPAIQQLYTQLGALRVHLVQRRADDQET